MGGEDIFFVWHYDRDDAVLAVQAYWTMREARQAISDYRHGPLYKLGESFDIMHDRISVPFGTDGIIIDKEL